MSPWMPKCLARSRLPSSSRMLAPSLRGWLRGREASRPGTARDGLDLGFVLWRFGHLISSRRMPPPSSSVRRSWRPFGGCLLGRGFLGCRFLGGGLLGRRLLGGGLAGGFLAAGLGGAFGDQFERLLERDLLGLDALGQGGVDLALVDVGAIAAIAHRDRAIGVLEGLDRGDRRMPRPKRPPPAAFCASRSTARLRPTLKTSSTSGRLA